MLYVQLTSRLYVQLKGKKSMLPDEPNIIQLHKHVTCYCEQCLRKRIIEIRRKQRREFIYIVLFMCTLILIGEYVLVFVFNVHFFFMFH